jgi:hypothetical protein
MPLETPEERFARDEREAIQREQRNAQDISDMAEVLNTPAGYRVILRMIRSLGGGNGMVGDQSSMLMHNIAVQFLDDVRVAHPAALIAMCGDLWGVPHPINPQQE